jgi:membrane fusion protein (multidrug efflux system)
MRTDLLLLSSKPRSVVGAIFILLMLSACGAKEDAPAAAPANQPPPPEVGVVTTELQPVALQTELPGRK